MGSVDGRMLPEGGTPNPTTTTLSQARASRSACASRIRSRRNACTLGSAWTAGAGYAYVARPYEDELRALRARAALIESIEDRVITMTQAERRTFDELFKRNAAKR